MLYVRRDQNGRINAVFRNQQRNAKETLKSDHPDIVDFLFTSDSDGREVDNWIRNDLAMARVVEDLVDVLVRKDLIAFTDLPLEAQRKLVSRHGRRDDFAYVSRLFPSDPEDELG